MLFRSLKFLLNGHVSVQLPLIEILKGISGFYILPFLLLKPVNQDDRIIFVNITQNTKCFYLIMYLESVFLSFRQKNINWDLDTLLSLTTNKALILKIGFCISQWLSNLGPIFSETFDTFWQRMFHVFT